MFRKIVIAVMGMDVHERRIFAKSVHPRGKLFNKNLFELRTIEVHAPKTSSCDAERPIWVGKKHPGDDKISRFCSESNILFLLVFHLLLSQHHVYLLDEIKTARVVE